MDKAERKAAGDRAREMGEGRSMEPLGFIVSAYRRTLGLRQVDMAVRLGLDQSTVSRFESRDTVRCLEPKSLPVVEAYARDMGVPLDYFVEYRAFRIAEIARKHPDLADEVYDLLVAHAAAGEGRSKRRSKGT
jgi:transcriptional regulator with XRE-family HTH domain